MLGHDFLVGEQGVPQLMEGRACSSSLPGGGPGTRGELWMPVTALSVKLRAPRPAAACFVARCWHGTAA